MMKGLLVRREKSHDIRNNLIQKGVEFFEESKYYYNLFLFPGDIPEESSGKIVELIDENGIDHIHIPGKTFKIKGSNDVIDIFAPKVMKSGLRVKLDDPDIILEIHKWGNKYLVNVVSASHLL